MLPSSKSSNPISSIPKTQKTEAAFQSMTIITFLSQETWGGGLPVTRHSSRASSLSFTVRWVDSGLVSARAGTERKKNSQTKPHQTKPGQPPKTDQNRPKQTKTDHYRAKQTKTDQNSPKQKKIRPKQTKPDQNRPIQTNTDQLCRPN